MFAMNPLVKDPAFYPGQWGIPGSDSPLGIRMFPEGVTYYVHSENLAANDLNAGTNPMYPLATIAQGLTNCTAGQNDVVVVVGQATAYPVAAEVLWNKNYTHLVGISPDLYGVGQRVRIVAPAAIAATHVMTVSGAGCMIKNIQFNNENAAAADSGALSLSGQRCLFEDVFFLGMFSAVAAARAGSYSLTISGDENQFVRCTIGTGTQMRTANNAELIFTSDNCNRNKFVKCEVISWSVTAGKFLVRFAVGARPFVTQFEDCAFMNLNMTGAGAAGATLTDAFNDATAFYHMCVLRGKTVFTGCTGVSDVLTNIWSSEAVPAAGFGIAVNPAA
jgi:hypothetical protein